MYEPNKVRCPLCGKYITRSRLSNHYITVHGNPENKLKPENLIKRTGKVNCFSCGKICKHYWEFKTESGNTVVYCSICKNRIGKPKKNTELLDRKKTFSSSFGMGKLK
jgi:DNA-directed RNA polymerase subunit N (RpoN/RPB10)